MVLKGEESKLRQPPLTGAPVHAIPWQRKSCGKWYHMTDNILWRRTSHDRGRPVSDDNQWQMRVAWQITSHNRGHPMTEDVPSKRMFRGRRHPVTDDTLCLRTSNGRWYRGPKDIQWQMVSMAEDVPWQMVFHGRGHFMAMVHTQWGVVDSEETRQVGGLFSYRILLVVTNPGSWILAHSHETNVPMI